MGRETFKKIITSPDKISEVNPKNIDLMNKFLREKTGRCSELTISNYKSDLSIFFCWNLDNNDNKIFTDIRKLEFSEFFSYAISELKWGSARFSRAKSTLSSFSNFIEYFMDDVFPTFRNVILKAVESMPKEAKREKTILSDAQVNSVLEHFSEIGELQICCWFSLAVASGSRFAELLRFTTDIIDIENTVFNGIFLETKKSIKTKGRTSTGKMLKKYVIKDIFYPYYEKWLVKRQEILDKNGKNHNFIFIKENGDPAQQATARLWVKEIENFLQVPFYPHCLRHYIVTYLSKIGINPDLIIELMGWSSRDMIFIYNDTQLKDREFKELDNLENRIKNNSL